MIDISEHDFGGRLHPKDNEQINWENLVDLPNARLAVVYKRQSKHEQVKHNVWSLKAQDSLADLARVDGYFDELIYVEERDLGISGTKGREDRPGLANLIEMIEAGQVEAIYVVHISRLYRDQTLINALALGELIKKHGVIIVTPQMRLNLRDKMHMRLYRMEVERAADEIELMLTRLIGARNLKARAGFYGGESIPVGYIVDTCKELSNGRPNPDYHRFQIYEPHMEVVRVIFERLAMPGMTPIRLARYFKQHGIVFPPFPPELNTPVNRKALLRCKRNAGGNYPISARWIHNIATNPAYIGWRIWEGEVTSKDAFPPGIDETTFWAVQERFKNGKSRPKKDKDPLPLAGLLYYGDEHGALRRMSYSNMGDRRPMYVCYDYALRVAYISVTAHVLDGPISEAVLSQIALPGLAGEILDQLTSEYEQAKEQATSYRREMCRLEAEIENLRGNLARNVLGADNVAWIDQQIQVRLARIRELADLESRPIGAMVGRAVPGQSDIGLVKSFLENLDERWSDQPNGLKNAFFHLLLDQVIIWCDDPLKIRVKLIWQVGLEQELLIHRRVSGRRRAWDESELEIMRNHYETASKHEILAMLPGRSWRAIIHRSRLLGLSRAHFTGRSRGAKAKKFTPEEDELIKKYCAGEIGADEVLSTGRTMESVLTRAKRLGLRPPGVRWEWIKPPRSEQAHSSKTLNRAAKG